MIEKLLGDIEFITGREQDGDRAYGRAIERLESLPQEPATDPRYRRSLASLFRRMEQLSFCATDQPGKAASFHARAVPAWDRRLAPLSLNASEQAERMRAYARLAGELELLGRFHEAVAPRSRAVELAEELVRQYPSFDGYRRDLAEQHGSLGHLLLTTARPREAITHIEKSIQLRPDDAGALDLHAWALATHENPYGQRAVEIAEQLVRKYPNQPNYRSRLGQAMIRAGDWQRGRDALESLIRSQGGEADDWLFLAMALSRHGEAAEARRWYRKAAAKLDGTALGQNPHLKALQGEAAALIAQPAPHPGE